MNLESYLASLCRAVPYHIVEKVLVDPSESALAFREEPGSVLFADLVSFTAMCERLAQGGPERLGRLSRVLDELFTGFELDAFFPFGGYVVEFGGDAMTVIFLGEDHARRCAAAALSCQAAVKRIAEGSLGEDAKDLRIRVGMATGLVHLSVLGDLTRRVSVCAGAPVHRALLLQQRAQPGEVVIDEESREALIDVAFFEKEDGRARLHGLETWPQREALEPLGGRIQTRVQEKIAMLEPFVAAPLARRLRTLPGGWRIEAEIRRPVILFADITGYVEEPRYLQIAVSLSRSLLRAFQKYDGLVLKVTATETGHRVMVLFGLHQPSEHDAEKAILAALEAMTRLRGYVEGPRASLALRVGIHSGPVFFGAIGGEHKHDLTALGDAVNVTARAASLAGAWEVVVSGAALEAAGGAFVSSSRGLIKVKGREEPLPLYAIHGPTEGRAHYARRRSTQRFTAGHGRQFAQLRAAADEAIAGHGRLLGLTGPEGSGKSHLLSNLVDYWLEHGGMAVVTRCRFATRTTPLAPVRELFATLTGSTAGDADEVRVQRLRSYLSGLDLGIAVPELLSILQPVRRPDGFDESVVDLADLHARDRLIAALVRIVDRRIAVAGTRLLYVVEDMHHADSLTMELASRLATLPRNRSFLMIGTWRPDPLVQPLSAAVDLRVQLEDLDLPATTELVCHEMDATGVDPGLAEFLWRRTGGNPEHLVQTVRFLADRMLLTVRDGTVLAAQPWRDRLEEVVPPRWEHVALARLDGLNEVERRVLRTASAIGTAFGEELLERAAGGALDRELVSDAIAALEANRIFTADPAQPHAWRFRDDATRAIAYSVIPAEERVRVHQRIADVLESVPESRQGTAAAAIAHHRERAGQVHEALKWYGTVAMMAFRAGLETEAEHFAGKWDELHSRLPPGDEAHRRHAAWISIIRLYLLGSRGRPREALLRAKELLRTHRRDLDPAAVELVRFTVARSREALGMLSRAKAALRRVQHSQVDSLAFESSLALGQLAECTRDLASGREHLERIQRLARENPSRLMRAALLRGWLSLAEGRTGPAAASFAEARERALRYDQFHLRGVASNGTGMCALLEGRFEDASRSFDDALRIARGLGNLREETSALIRQGATWLFESRFDEALGLLERAAAMVKEGGYAQLTAEAQVHLGAALAFTRDVSAGIETCRSGVESAERAGLWTPALFGRVQLARLAKVEPSIRSAEELAAVPESLRRGLPLVRAIAG